jgi:purine-cytosine permease-like protein
MKKNKKIGAELGIELALKFRGLLGTVSLVIGLLAANLALFGWCVPYGSSHLLGEYAHYACACGGFAAIVFGAMMINDFFVLRGSIASSERQFFLETEEDREVVAQK